MIGDLQKVTLLNFPGKAACTVFLTGCDSAALIAIIPSLLCRKTEKKIALDCLSSQQSRGYPSLLISNIFFYTSLSLFGGTSLCPPNLRLSIYKHRSAMTLPAETACISGVMSSFGAETFLP